MSITKEDVRLVNEADQDAQENNRSLDRALSEIYCRAEHKGYGWETIAERHPSLFYEALALIS